MSKLQQLFSNPWFAALAVLLLGLPLFLLNMRESSGWGGDFALYIHQAMNLVDGLSQDETGYVYNPNFPMLSPPAYPIGFPLLLAPVYAWFGNDIAVFVRFQSLWLLLAGIGVFAWYRQVLKYGLGIALVLVLLFWYHPRMVEFKVEVLSEIPFLGVLMLFLLLFHRDRSWKNSIALGICLGMLISLRSIGVVAIGMLGLLVLQRIWDYRKQQLEWKSLQEMVLHYAGMIGIGLAFYVVLNTLIFEVPSGGILAYSNSFQPAKVGQLVLENLEYYRQSWMYFWLLHFNAVPVLSWVLSWLGLSLLLIGLIQSWRKRWEAHDFLMVVYLVVILIYPYRAAGLRFFFPILPFMLHYTACGLMTMLRVIPKARPWVLGVVMFFVGMMSWDSYADFFKHQKALLKGPQVPLAQEAFTFVQEETEPDATFVFFKPRVLSLYTGRNAGSLSIHEDAEEAKRQIQALGADYILLHKDLPNRSMDLFVEAEADRLEEVFRNDHFRCYRINW